MKEQVMYNLRIEFTEDGHVCKRIHWVPHLYVVLVMVPVTVKI